MPDATDSGENASAAKPGKLFRGLGNSFGRALARAASGQGAGSAQPASSGTEARPATPKPSDDPFPDGEPQEEKKPSESQPDE